VPEKITENCTKVTVPRSDKRLMLVTRDRVERLKEHLRDVLREIREAKKAPLPTPIEPEPDGFKAVIARTACTLCKGHCCRNGADDAFLDDRTLARFKLTQPKISDQAIVRLYAGHVPSEGYIGSCIFHGKKGCTLGRSMRADICNTYFCRDLGAYLRKRSTPRPTVVIAGGIEKSPVLRPRISLVSR
jgi:hypothetical protein